MLAWIHRIGFAEGLSAFALFCVAMPLKYAFDSIGKNEFFAIGMVHGVLWVLYAVVATVGLFVGTITIRQYLLLALLSLFPLGPIVADHYVLARSNQDV